MLSKTSGKRERKENLILWRALVSIPVIFTLLVVWYFAEWASKKSDVAMECMYDWIYVPGRGTVHRIEPHAEAIGLIVVSVLFVAVVTALQLLVIRMGLSP